MTAIDNSYQKHKKGKFTQVCLLSSSQSLLGGHLMTTTTVSELVAQTALYVVMHYLQQSLRIATTFSNSNIGTQSNTWIHTKTAMNATFQNIARSRLWTA